MASHEHSISSAAAAGTVRPAHHMSAAADTGTGPVAADTEADRTLQLEDSSTAAARSRPAAGVLRTMAPRTGLPAVGRVEEAGSSGAAGPEVVHTRASSRRRYAVVVAGAVGLVEVDMTGL